MVRREKIFSDFCFRKSTLFPEKRMDSMKARLEEVRPVRKLL